MRLVDGYFADLIFKNNDKNWKINRIACEGIMPNHMLLMSFDGTSYLNLLYTLERFLEYSFALLCKKNKINFCYVGTASNDRLIEDLFFTSFMYCKFGNYIRVSKLSLTKKLTPKQIEDHTRQQDIIFIGGGNTHQMLTIWEKKGFTAILNKLKNEDQLPLLAGVSAGGMYPFHSGLSDYIPNQYAPLPCFGWLTHSFCPHAGSNIKRLCEFDDNRTHHRLPAYIAAIKAGKLPPGFAVPDHCMLHFYNNQYVHALSAYQNITCSFVTSEKIDSLETTFLTRENSIHIAEQSLQKINHKLITQDPIFIDSNSLPKSA